MFSSSQSLPLFETTTTNTQTSSDNSKTSIPDVDPEKRKYIDRLKKEYKAMADELYKFRFYLHPEKKDGDADEEIGFDGKKGIPFLAEPEESPLLQELRKRFSMLKNMEGIEGLLVVRKTHRKVKQFIDSINHPEAEQSSVLEMEQTIDLQIRPAVGRYINDQEDTKATYPGDKESDDEQSQSKFMRSSVSRQNDQEHPGSMIDGEELPPPQKPLKLLKESSGGNHPALTVNTDAEKTSLPSHLPTTPVSAAASMVHHSKSESHMGSGEEAKFKVNLSAPLKKMLLRKSKHTDKPYWYVLTDLTKIPTLRNGAPDSAGQSFISTLIGLATTNMNGPIMHYPGPSYDIPELKDILYLAYVLYKQIRLLNDYLEEYQKNSCQHHCLRRNLLKQSIDYARDMSAQSIALLKKYNDDMKDYYKIISEFNNKLQEASPDDSKEEKDARAALRGKLKEIEVTDTPLMKLKRDFDALRMTYLTKLANLTAKRRGFLFFGKTLKEKIQSKNRETAKKALEKREKIKEFSDFIKENMNPSKKHKKTNGHHVAPPSPRSGGIDESEAKGDMSARRRSYTNGHGV